MRLRRVLNKRCDYNNDARSATRLLFLSRWLRVCPQNSISFLSSTLLSSVRAALFGRGMFGNFFASSV